jgi:hypothetical protein
MRRRWLLEHLRLDKFRTGKPMPRGNKNMANHSKSEPEFLHSRSKRQDELFAHMRTGAPKPSRKKWRAHLSKEKPGSKIPIIEDSFYQWLGVALGVK